MPPAERYDQTIEHCQHYLKVFGNDNPIMQSFGVTIGRNAHSVRSKQIPL